MPNDQSPSESARLGELTTEGVDESRLDLDLRSTAALVAEMNREDATVPAAIERALPAITDAVDAIAERMAQGGRLFYTGAGTPGRIGILDASECPPTFGTDPGLVVGIIAGGQQAMFQAVENAEDDPVAGAADLANLHLTELDSVVGISASGRTPYVIGAIDYAESQGALTVGLTCNAGSEIGRRAQIAIEVPVGPEFVSGSTRLKAGTAQKLVLNMISTIVMIRLGKTYGNLMVDLKVTNHKLRLRAERTVMRIAEVGEEAAMNALDQTDNSVKEAIVLLSTGLDPAGVRELLAAHGGGLRATMRSGEPTR